MPTGIDHGTVTAVALHQPFEITTLRRDVESYGRRAKVAFTDDWIEDAARRDFTFNAMSCAPDGQLYDPFGGAASTNSTVGSIIQYVASIDNRRRLDSGVVSPGGRLYPLESVAVGKTRNYGTPGIHAPN